MATRPIRHQRPFMVLVVALAALQFLGCGQQSPPLSENDLKAVYDARQGYLEALREDVLVDLEDRTILEIGDKGQERAGVVEGRFESYIERLKTIPAERITAYRPDATTVEVQVLLARSGIVMAGCISTLTWLSEGAPVRPDWADPYYRIELSDGWVGETKCN